MLSNSYISDNNNNNNNTLQLQQHDYYYTNTNVTALPDTTSPPAPTVSTVGGDQPQTVRNILIIVAYSLIIGVSLSGNLLVCKIACTKRKMRTTTNILIASLALSDIVMAAISIPFNLARLLLLDWPFGSLPCLLVPLIQNSCVYVSTFTMTFISLHRWRTITKRSVFRRFSALKLFSSILVIWLMAILFSLPMGIFNRLTEVQLDHKLRIRCRPHYPKLGIDFPLFLSVEILLTQYVLPLTITCFVYVKIGQVVVRQGKLAGMSNDDRKRRQIEAKRRRIIMLALAVIVFAVCWAPINLYYLFVDFKVFKHNFKIFIVCHWLAMSSVCYNPFIYCYYNASYRSMVKESLECVFRCLKYYKVQTGGVGAAGGGVGGVTTVNGGGGGGGGGGAADDDDDYDVGEDTVRECTKYTVCNTERIELMSKARHMATTGAVVVNDPNNTITTTVITTGTTKLR
ncbi:neuropeptide Y receptor type 5-like [Oppia nitens]|uniref:neuropeptide Y receptor type 5-like n=1 Tax=Oppia nitens TaxID=1686743 RepID=UPI0023DA59F1|nr:neuropeptide Y receptor type 5-like [Oppia nitens]